MGYTHPGGGFRGQRKSAGTPLYEDRRKAHVERKIARMKICEKCGVRCSTCTRLGSLGKCCLEVSGKLKNRPQVTVAA